LAFGGGPALWKRIIAFITAKTEPKKYMRENQLENFIPFKSDFDGANEIGVFREISGKGK
jgi:hypothetical protein